MLSAAALSMVNLEEERKASAFEWQEGRKEGTLNVSLNEISFAHSDG